MELKSRADAIGCSLKTIARAAGVAPSTAYRALKPEHDIRTRNLARLSEALLAREAAVAAHLERQAPKELAA